MAIGEYRFYEQQNYKSSLEAYEKVLQHPKSQLYDLALFKTAWCYWKLGDTTKSALRFKDVLDLAKKKAGRTEAEQKRAAELQGQALDYLVELFTEDDTKSAHDAFEFLAQIGGKQYSRKVLKQLADTVFDQTRYERAVEAYRLLIELDPERAPRRPTTTARSSSRTSCSATSTTAVAEMRKLANNYGGAQRLGRRQQGSAQDRRPRADAGRGPDPHAGQDDARARRSRTRRRPRSSTRSATRAPPSPTSSIWPTSPTRRDAAELRYLRADILYFKLGKYEDGRARVPGVGKSQPVGKYHKDALLQAMGAFEKVRKPPGAAASARSPRAIGCSARRPTSTRRCSRRTRRSSPSSTRTASSSSTTATTTRRSNASA